MSQRQLLLLVLCSILLMFISVPGAYAIWQYATGPVESVEAGLTTLMGEWIYPKYTITYLYNGETLEKIDVFDNSTDVATANASAEQKVAAKIGENYEFSHWMNSGSTKVVSIPAGNTENVVLYPSFEGRYTATFVDQHGNNLGSVLFTANNSGKTTVVQKAGQITAPEIEDCVFDYWQVHITQNGTTTKTPLSDCTFNSNTIKGNISIYPVYTYNGDVNLIPVDEDSDGDTDYYQVGGYSNPKGSDLVVIPAYVNGIPITAISANAFSSYEGVHSVVIPETVTSAGVNILASDWGLFDSGETVTIYYEGSYEDWLVKEATFTDGWDDGLGTGSRIFFLDGKTVDVSQGYMEYTHKGNGLWQAHSGSWRFNSVVTAALRNEYDNTCNCKDCNGVDRPDRAYWRSVVIK